VAWVGGSFLLGGHWAPVPRIFLVTGGARDLQGKSFWLAGTGPEKFSRIVGFPMTYAKRGSVLSSSCS
jgi:hypothetical protein